MLYQTCYPTKRKSWSVKGKPKQVLVSELRVDGLVLIRPGASIPVDGVIVDGSSSVDETAITGESKPVSKTVDDEVIAGTGNQDGSLAVKVTKLGQNTALAMIMRLVAEAQSSKSYVATRRFNYVNHLALNEVISRT